MRYTLLAGIVYEAFTVFFAQRKATIFKYIYLLIIIICKQNLNDIVILESFC